DRGLVAARAGTNLEEDVLLIARIAGYEKLAQLGFGGFDFAPDAGHLFGAQRAHSGVGIVEHFPGGVQVTLQIVVAAKALCQRLEARIFHGQVAELLGVARNLRGCKQPPDLFEAVGHLLQALTQGLFHGCCRARHSPGSLRAVTRHTMCNPSRGARYGTLGSGTAFWRCHAGGKAFMLLSRTTSGGHSASGRKVAHMQRPQALAVLGTLALLAAGCASAPPKADANSHDPAALTIVAEVALARGDCKAASESYAEAAQHGAAPLARRASEVALGCEHVPAAWKSATRWRELAPADREADAMYAAVAIKLFRIADAKAGIADFAKTQGGSDGAGLTELAGLLLEQSDAPAVFEAMSSALDPAMLSPQI